MPNLVCSLDVARHDRGMVAQIVREHAACASGCQRVTSKGDV